VLQLKDVRDQAAILQRDVDNAQRAYDGILARTNTMMLESQVNQANVSPLEGAVAPSIPASPRVGLTLALGTLMAMVLAVAVSLLVETLDRRFRVDEESEWLLNVPVVGHLPSYRKLMSDTAKGSSTSLSLPVIRALPARG
jgi:capsular polysaccharide biosynthesis protein